MPHERFRIGEFEFDAASGELRREGAPVERLAPQPSRLLALLAGRGGELATRDEIREALWPGVEIDFDTGLHFCVRQVRAALGDTAGEPRYVETLPRRGYRLIAPVAQAGPVAPLVSPAGSSTAPGPTPGRRRVKAVLGTLGFLLVVVAGVALLVDDARVGRGAAAEAGRPEGAPPRLGILPTVPPVADARFAGTASIADAILDGLEREIAAGRAEIVGPTGTAPALAEAEGSHRAVAEAYALGHLVHIRFVPDAEPPFLLAELIRARDGAHVWVRRYESWPDPDAIGRDVAREVASRLDLNETRSAPLAAEPVPD